MTRTRVWVVSGLGLAAAVVLILVVILASAPGGNTTAQPTGPASPSASASPSLSPSASPTSTPKNSPMQVVKTWAKRHGYMPAQVSINKIDPNLPGTHSTREDAFAPKPLLTRWELEKFLTSNKPRAVKARKLLGNLKGVTWVSVQFNFPVIYHGMKYLVDGKVETGGTVTVPKGDVIWLAVRNGKVVTIVRGPCGNFIPTPPTVVPPTHAPPPYHKCTAKKPSPKKGYKVVLNASGCGWHYVRLPHKPKKPCGCVSKPKASQPVPSAPAAPSGTPSQAPSKNPVGPSPTTGSKAPDPTQNGNDSGSKTGSGTTGGTTCISSGCQGGGPTPGQGSGGASSDPQGNQGNSGAPPSPKAP